MACGVHPDHWWAKTTDDGMELSRCLQPLDGLKSKLNVIHGLFNKNATGVGITPVRRGTFYRGQPFKRCRTPRWNQRGPSDCERHRTRRRCSELGARLRAADHGLSRDEFFHGVQFPYFLAKRDIAGPDGSLPFPRLR